MRLILFSVLGLCLASCQPPLERQPKVKYFSGSPQFSDGASARPPVDGQVAYDTRSEVEPELTRTLLERGHARYDIYCSVCHGLTGHGDGLVTQRGFPKPPDFQRIAAVELSPVAIFKVISEGDGAMPSFKAQLTPQDRWAVAHYIRILSLRERVPASELSREDFDSLQRSAR